MKLHGNRNGVETQAAFSNLNEITFTKYRCGNNCWKKNITMLLRLPTLNFIFSYTGIVFKGFLIFIHAGSSTFSLSQFNRKTIDMRIPEENNDESCKR